MTTVLPGPRVRGRSRRFLACLACGATALVAVSSCSAVKPNAIRVGNYEMSKSDFETELKAAAVVWEKNDQAVAQVGHAKTEDRKGWNPAFVANALGDMMLWRGVVDEFDEKKLKAADPDPAAKESLLAAYGGAKEFDKLPKHYRERQLALGGQIDALIKSETANLGSPEEYFAKNKVKYPDEVCSSHILLKTLPEAQAAKKRIEAGEKFAAVADALTQDPGGKGKGGDLGCTSPQSFVAEFAAAITTLKIGAISEPVQTQFGFHVITVTDRKAATYDSKKEQIATEMRQLGSQTAQKAVFSRLTPKTVSVDPSLGALDTSGEFLRIVPPKLKIEPTVTTAPPVSVQP